MRSYIFGVLMIVMGGSVLFGQTTSAKHKWIGTWTLNKHKTTFDSQFQRPGIDLNAFNQTLKLDETGGKIKVIAETTYSADTPPRVEEQSLSLDGAETSIGGLNFSFRRIDDTSFDIVGKINTKDANGISVNHFVVSRDGKTLTETKTQTAREAVPQGTDQTKGAIVRSSTSVFVFDKALR